MPNESSAPRRRILFMDDEANIRRVGVRMLQYLGFDAVPVADGDEAVLTYRDAMAEGQRFDAVILDLSIPGGMGGAETLAELLKLDPEVKAIVSSGLSGSDNDRYSSHGFCAAVAKPYEIATMGRTLEMVLRPA